MRSQRFRDAFARVRFELGRIRARLLLVMLVIVVVPLAGLELARLYERQLLDSLERDMRNQSVLAARTLEDGLRSGTFDLARIEDTLTRSAASTRTRLRVLGPSGVLADSHRDGPPEGPEPEIGLLGDSDVRDLFSSESWGLSTDPLEPGSTPNARWPDVMDRREVKQAFDGHPSAYTRVRSEHPEVLLFVTEPVRHEGRVPYVVYATRSTAPVLEALYRIRSGLVRVLAVAIVVSSIIVLLLSFSISRPLARLSTAARRIANGEPSIDVPVGGSGEIRVLGESIRDMADRLDSRARAVREFAADVAHELKSPLTSIRGAAELLESGAAEDPVARARFLGNIGDDAQRLDRLVSRLLELSRVESPTEPMTVLDLETLVRRAADRAGVDPSSIRYDAPRLVRGRAADLETALRNVLDNARKFSEPDDPIDVGVSSDGDRVEIRVADRGRGIAPDDLPRVFDRFYTTDADRKGIGLGLAIVRAVMEAHRGTASVASEPGAGTVVTLRLPAG
jgi:two-component system sensor histidine kinase ChvG